MGFLGALRREPAQIAGFLAALIQLLGATFVPMTVEQQGTLNAAVVAVLGFITAALVSGERAAAALAGLVQAVLACALAFGLHLAPSLQASVMVFVAAGSAFWLRTQLIAPGTLMLVRGRHESPQ